MQLRLLRVAFFSVALVFITASAPAQAPKNDDHLQTISLTEREAISVVARRTAAYNDHDIEAFLATYDELEYRLIKELWAYTDRRIAVRFAYEWHDDNGAWFRSYGNENWEFADNGLMRRRVASINDLSISADQRKYHWPQGRRPDDHPSLSDLDL